jgi:3'-phosphoadenosine 5'-phosphosulfate sulfotransferase (PAPS reductase)/FAD synthetase
MKARHVLGISGGKDSAALAIYMKTKYPDLDIDFYTCDTGKELDETYQLVENLKVFLGKDITLLRAMKNSPEDPFDHYLKMFGGYLPSSMSRWCTKKLKLEPFEQYVGNDPVVSYVGIRGDEDREGYISRKSNIQSIFPFRKNIWSEDVVNKVLANSNREMILDFYKTIDLADRSHRFEELLRQPIDPAFTQAHKLKLLLDVAVKDFNRLVFAWLQTTSYPLAGETYFPLVDNDEVLVREDIFNLLKESGVGVPAYYNKMPFEVNGQSGHYSRSRSGCYFCFFQQKIEWIWLYEQHPERFQLAMEYEKDGYTWNQEERLEDLIQPERMQQIKADYIKRSANSDPKSPYLLDVIAEGEGEGCAACFI